MKYLSLGVELKYSINIAVRVLLVIGITLLSWHLLGRLGASASPVRALNVLNRNIKHADVPSAIIVTLGSSHNVAIIPTMFDDLVLRLWTPGQNFEGGIFLTKYFERYLPKAKVFLFPVSIFSMRQTPGLHSGPVANLMFLEQYDSLFYRVTYDFNYHVKASARSFHRLDSWEAPIRKIFNLKREKPSRPHNPFVKDYVGKHIKHVDLAAKSINEEKVTQLASLIHDMNACLIFYDSPVSHNYLSKVKIKMPQLKNWKYEFRVLTDKINRDYCVYFIEDIFPLEHSKNRAYYSDQHHLNRKGAELFTPLLKNSIENLQLNL